MLVADPRLELRGMTEADLEGGLRLSRASGWNQTLEDWRVLLSLGPGLFRVAARDGCVAASGGAVRYGDALAWICMILVHPDERGRGLGTRIFDEVLALCLAEAASGRLASLGLDATPAGRGIYVQRGFVDGPQLARMRVEPGRGPSAPRSAPGDVAAMAAADLEAALEMDRHVFGADRAPLLRWALKQAPGLAFRARRGERLAGYCFGREGDLSSHVGPVVAEDPATAQALVTACLAQPRDRPLTLDARAEPEWLEALAGLGFRVARPLTRMYHGDGRPLSQPALEPVVLGPEFG